MKPSEAAMILTKISAYDRRTIGDADAEAWAEALDGQVTIKDALTAVRDHFRESADWLMPNMVIERARKIRRIRVREIGQPDVPSGLTAAQEREWVRVFWEEIHEIHQPTMQDGARAADPWSASGAREPCEDPASATTGIPNPLNERSRSE